MYTRPKVLLLNPMKYTVLSLFLLASAFFFLHPATAQLRLNPSAGFSASTLSNDPEGAEASARFGYQFGLALRTPGALYFSPGIFWQRSGTELRTEEEINLEVLQDDINLDALFLSLMAGYNLLDSNLLRLRAMAGLGGTLIVNVGENDLGLESDNFNTVLLGAPVGIGLDLGNIITVDMHYEFGLTNTFDNIFGLDVNAVNNVFRMNVGLLF